MKALVLTGVKEFEIQDLPTPEIQPNEVLINTAYAGVCGTDHDLYAGRPGSAAAVPPIVLGHENSGVVAAIGSEAPNCATIFPPWASRVTAVWPNSSPHRPP